MTRQKTLQVTTVIALVALTIPLTQSWAADPTPATPKSPAVTLERLYAQQIPLLLKSLESTQKAIEADHKDHALMELKKAQKLLATVQQTLGQHIKPAFANTVCPIMGAKINTGNVPASLVREFEGQKVAFCCAGCPTQWDKLSTSQKQAKLMKSKPADAMQP